MTALILSPTWREAHMCSPYMNLIEAAEHKAFKKFVVSPDKWSDEELRNDVNACDAVVVDYNNSYALDFYTNGPKFLIWADEHCHTADEVRGTEALHAKYDYVLVGSPLSPPKIPQYLYVNQETLAKRFYFPQCVPDVRPSAMDWASRVPRALLPSNVCPHVYRFRWKAGQLAGSGAPIDLLPHFQKVREAFLEHIGNYQYAITCNSSGWLNYTVAKYFEMPYMGAVTIATPLYEGEAQRLGFEHGKNIILTEDPHDIVRIMDGSKSFDREAISRAGVELMTKHHTASKRLDYLEKLVAKALGSKLNVADSVDVFMEVRSAA